jgi:hypothetical protein
MGIPIVFLTSLVNAQTLEGVITEEYYSGTPDANSVTYRVYVDLGPGDKLLAVYGFDDEDPTTGNSLSFETTTAFYNDAFGAQFGEGINTALFVPFPDAALDSWVSFGGAASGQLGIPKNLDPDSESDPSLVPSLTNVPADGLSPSANAGQDGFLAGTTASTSTLGMDLSGVNAGGNFVGSMDGSYFVLGGVEGAGDENVVCIGQFTTDGDFSFSINVQIQSADGENQVYTHTNAVQPDGSEAIVFPGLNFPEPIVECAVDAGTLTADNSEVELSESSVTISATANGDIVVPEGYATVYVLTMGEDLVIQQTAASPSFEVSMIGDYTIHTLVYDDDPESEDFLDLSVVVPGVTTGGDVLALIGDKCADLDVAGAPITVVEAVVPGCINADACNFNPDANEDDGSCFFDGDPCDADGEEGVIEDCECVPVFVPVPGCTNEDACNFNAEANVDDGSCVLNGDECDANGEPGVIENCDCVPVFIPVPGCTNEEACNFNPEANEDDGSCVLNGDACELEGGETGIIEDCVCVEQTIQGCTDPSAENFNPEATEDDGSCEYAEVPACDGETGGFEGLIVEEYYVDGPVEGAKTYRVYADLAPGYRILAVYGYDDDAEETGNDLAFTTSTGFYNDEFGASFGDNINTSLFETFENASLDSYISFGGAASDQLGIPKADDTDESSLVPFLTNVPADGISPSEIDGYTEGEPSATSTLGMDIDGVSTDGSSFVGTMDGSFFVLGGVVGTGENNTVLLGQFTTDGEFGYRINLQVQSPTGENELYVHTNAMQPDGTMGRVCSELRFPEPAPECTADGGEILFADGSDSQTICVDDNEESYVEVDVITPASEDNAVAWVITEPDGNILAVVATEEDVENIDFDAAGPGNCLIWQLSFDPENSNVLEIAEGIENEVPANASDLEGCFDLSNSITVVRENCEPSDCENYVYYLADILEDGTTNIYSVELNGTTAELTSLVATSEYEVHIAFNEEDGLIYAVSKLDGSFRTLDPATGEFGPVEMLDTEVFEIVGAAFNADGKLLILSQSENAIYSVTLGANAVSVFDSYSPTLGGDIDFGSDGALYLATREGFGTFYLAIPDEIASDILIGDAPQLVTGIADTEDQNLIFSHRDATTLMVREYDGTMGSPYDIVLDGEPFMTFNGDLASGCGDNQPQEECEQVIYYTNQPAGGTYTLYSTVLNGDGTSTNTALLSDLGSSHIGVTPDGSTIYIVGGSDLQTYSVETGTIVNTVDIVSNEGADLSGFPACVVTEDGTLYIGGNGNNVWEVDPGTGIATLFASININGGDLIEAPTGEGGAGELWVITRNNGQFTRISDGTSFTVPVPEINGAAVLENGNVLLANGDGDGEDALIEVSLEDLSVVATYDTDFNVTNGDLAATCAEPMEMDEDAIEMAAEEQNNTLSSFPNPTNGISQAIFVTGQTERATLEVYDMNGRLVEGLFSGIAEEGVEYRVDFDGLALPNGVYIYRLTTTNETVIDKFIIAK